MKSKTLCFALFALLVAAALSGCATKKPPIADKPPVEPPKAAAPVATLKATPETVDKGQSVTLSWTTENASTVNIDGLGTVAASGSKTVNPGSSTTYHLTASGAGGQTDANARVTVNIPTTTTAGTVSDKDLFEQAVKDIFFNYDNFDVRSTEQQTLIADAEFLAKHPNMKLTIEGHCDERGSEDYNMGLGENRASVVRDTLVKNGVSADRVRIISLGKEQPFCTKAEDESCWQQNRRAHFVFGINQ